MKLALLLCVVVLGLSGCGGSGGQPESTATPGSGTTSPPAETAASPETTEPPSIDQSLYPNGYPKVVKVSSLPEQVRSWYEMSHTKKAVAVAPGVWAELQDGAEMQDALNAGVLDGFCSSIKAYERKCLNGEDQAGTCW